MRELFRFLDAIEGDQIGNNVVNPDTASWPRLVCSRCFLLNRPAPRMPFQCRKRTSYVAQSDVADDDIRKTETLKSWPPDQRVSRSAGSQVLRFLPPG